MFIILTMVNALILPLLYNYLLLHLFMHFYGLIQSLILILMRVKNAESWYRNSHNFGVQMAIRLHYTACNCLLSYVAYVAWKQTSSVQAKAMRKWNSFVKWGKQIHKVKVRAISLFHLKFSSFFYIFCHFKLFIFLTINLLKRLINKV